ncbi:hypothetical protein [Rhizobium leguminosarum]|uniref:hypothetical protein n=1 Tax=Rhizobium leguminosarum TaxID=384 RepID=UPI00143F5E98|nr:hypothetical protein [Rhizobium leguminosarum]NKL21271.1 hypothetical protein [Rhizobium leguminosarum bv. viciae]NKL56777.1 hypothetical protein [Rhizobium leguminosarum bv. viciae]
MLDNPQKWKPVPHWATAGLDREGISARTLHSLTQCLVSGNLEAFATQHGLDLGAGALGLARGARYTARLARDRLIAVGLTAEEMSTGWHKDGYAVTPMNAALHVFEFTGPGILEVVARATSIDPQNAGPCAAVQFAGVTGCLYFHESQQRMRLHIERGLAAYIWQWLQEQPIFG